MKLVTWLEDKLIHYAALRLQKRWEGKVRSGTPLVYKV